MMREKIKYNQPREFGETFNISVKFLRENFKILLLSLLYIAGPFILLTSIANVIYSHSVADTFANLFKNKDFKIVDLFNYQYFVSIIITALSNLIITAVIFEFMLLYSQKSTKEIAVGTIARAILKDFGKLALTLIVFYLIAIVVIAISGGISIGLTTVHWSFAIVIGIIIFILLIIYGANILYLVSTTYLERIFRTTSITESFRKTRFAMKDNFWWTWLLMLCLFVISMIIGVAMNLPAAFVQFTITITHLDPTEYKMIFSIITVITSTIHILLSSFLLIFIAFHHFSLVEKKEGTGLIERINEIGQVKKQSVEQEY